MYKNVVFFLLLYLNNFDINDALFQYILRKRPYNTKQMVLGQIIYYARADNDKTETIIEIHTSRWHCIKRIRTVSINIKHFLRLIERFQFKRHFI